MAERRINWGADATDAQYRTGDDESNNRFIVAEDLDAGTVLLEYDESAGEWVSRGAVNVDGNDVSNVGALDAQSVNSTHYVAPTESIQTAIDDLASQSNIDLGRGNDTGHVYLQPDAEYDDGGEIHVKPGVILHGNGGTITHSGDHNLIFLDNGAHARGLQLDVDHTLSTSASSAIVLDTTRSRDGKYSIDGSSSPVDSHATASGTILGDGGGSDPTMHGLELNDDATEGPITIGCRFDLEIFAMNDALRFDSTNFINGVQFNGNITSCVTHIHHIGDSPAINKVNMVQQAAFNTDQVIWNETSQDSVFLSRKSWDPSNSDNTAYRGPNISFFANTKANYGDHADGSSGVRALAIKNGSIYMTDVTNNEKWEFNNGFNGAMNIETSNGLQFQIKPDGFFGMQGSNSAISGVDRFQNMDLKSSPPSNPGSGDWYLDDGTNTSSGNLGIRIYDGSSWVDQN